MKLFKHKINQRSKDNCFNFQNLTKIMFKFFKKQIKHQSKCNIQYTIVKLQNLAKFSNNLIIINIYDGQYFDLRLLIIILIYLFMLLPDFPERQPIRFPPLIHKPKSTPSTRKQIKQIRQIKQGELIDAKSWIYYSGDTYYGYKADVKRQIASLTKIMTLIVCLQLCEKYKINTKTAYFKITEWACQTNGTSANLLQNGWISVQDLMYGLMLPSGNDAAVCLSQNLGAVIYFDKTGDKTLIQQIRSIDLTQDFQSVRFYTQEFINIMNSKAKSLKMTKTRFANSHGMDHVNNYSCCQDVLTLCQYALKNQYFKKIVSTVNHKATYKFYKQDKVISKYITWTNTNKLLDKKDVYGIKTGITNKAGGCLATLFQTDSQNNVIIIVLGSNSQQTRFKDTLKIMNWALEEFNTQYL